MILRRLSRDDLANYLAPVAVIIIGEAPMWVSYKAWKILTEHLPDEACSGKTRNDAMWADVKPCEEVGEEVA